MTSLLIPFESFRSGNFDFYSILIFTLISCNHIGNSTGLYWQKLVAARSVGRQFANISAAVPSSLTSYTESAFCSFMIYSAKPQFDQEGNWVQRCFHGNNNNISCRSILNLFASLARSSSSNQFNISLQSNLIFFPISLIDKWDLLNFHLKFPLIQEHT
jgi:hypothetical protein